MKNEFKRYVFADPLLANWNQQNKRIANDFLDYLIRYQLIREKAIEKGAILEVYKKMNKDESISKTDAVYQIAHQFNVSERKVWGIMRGIKFREE